MNQAANKSRVILGTTAMEVTREPVANFATEYFNKALISRAIPIKINSKPAAPNDVFWNYRFDSMVCVNVIMNDGSNFMFDLHEITGQATWLPTLAGQKACVDAINAWL